MRFYGQSLNRNSKSSATYLQFFIEPGYTSGTLIIKKAWRALHKLNRHEETDPCNGRLHSRAIGGMELFNTGKYFDAHEELEIAWNEEKGHIRELYQGILQISVTYLHITRANYQGAIKVYIRAMRRLKDWPEVCRGIQVGQLKRDAEVVMKEVERLGSDHLAEFDLALFKKIEWSERRVWMCDKCGSQMHEKNCKVSCPNCGNRFDCSDLNIYFD
jgi:rubrerythrin